MFKKLKEKIRYSLRYFLGVSELEKGFKTYKKDTDRDLFNHQKNLEWCKEKFELHSEKINGLHRTIHSAISIGSDIVQSYDRNGSWAVVCIEGKFNVVKFVNLKGKDGQHVLEFLKQFEAGRYVNDTPMAYLPKEMFIDWDK